MQSSVVRLGTRVLLASACALTLAASGNAGRRSGELASRPWLVYTTAAHLRDNYSCADVPHRLNSLRTWPSGVLPSPGQTAKDPAWSPDGQRVAFSSGDVLCTNGDGIGQIGAQIWVVDSTRRNLHSVTTKDPSTGGPLDRSPSWSPDGRRIAFARVDITRGSGGIYVVGADGRGLTRLSRHTAIVLAWAPEGRSIAFVPGDRLAFAESGANRVALLDIPSGRVRTLRALAYPNDLSWSPDGRRIAVAQDQAISILDTNGRTLQRIPVSPSSRFYVNGVTWAPDGRRIAYSYGGEVFTVGLDGRGTNRIVAGQTPDWRP